MIGVKKTRNNLKHITERANGRFQICLHIDKDGKRRTVTRQAADLAEAIAIRDEMVRLQDIGAIDELLQGRKKADTMSVSQAVEKWMREDVTKRGIKKTTLEKYQYAITRYLPYVSTMRIDNIDKQIFKQPFLSQGGRQCAVRAYQLFYKMFDWLVSQDIITHNPLLSFKDIRFGEAERVPRRAFTKDEQSAFLEAAKKQGIEWYYIFKLYFESSMRRGELVALQWQDVDFNNQLLYVRRNIVYTKGGESVSTPKTKRSNRCIPFSDTLREYLEPLYAKRKSDTDFVFTNQRSQKYAWMSPQKIEKMFRVICITAGLQDKGLTVHSTRHTTASRLHEAGVSLSDIMQIGGWSSKGLPLDCYIHTTQQKIKDAMQRIF